MRRPSVSQLTDHALVRELEAAVVQDRGTAAWMLDLIAEVDGRRLYLPAGFSSMYLYCIGHFRMSDDCAYKRIHAARAARRFPAIIRMVAKGELHLSAVVMLAAHLTEDNAQELLAAATDKTKAEIERLLAQRFPRPDLPTLIEALAPSSAAPDSGNQLAPGQVSCRNERPDEPAPARVEGLVPPPVPTQVVTPRPRVTPLAPERFALQVTIGQDTHDKLRHAQALLSHQVRSGDVAQVLDRALDALIAQLEKQKFAATDRPRASHRCSKTDGRHIPAEVKRAVWERDGGQCTFRSDTGHRCEARTLLEFDHVDAFARGGQATIGGIRLRCRAHNKYEAERTFGIAFMNGKRDRARHAVAI